VERPLQSVVLGLSAAALMMSAQRAQARDAAPSERSERTARSVTPMATEVVQYEEAVAMYRLGYVHSAYDAFSRIAEIPLHTRRAAALPWLVALAAVLPEPADVASTLARYDDRELAPYDERVGFLVARHELAVGSDDRAARRFAAIERRSSIYARAQLWLGITNVRQRKSAPAIDAFRRVMRAVSDGQAEPRLGELATLSIARTLYSAAFRLDENNSPTSDARTLSAAVAQYRLIAPESELWPSAQLELGWAYFMAGEHDRALGAIFSLDTPYFPDLYVPEAEMLRIVIYLAACRYDPAQDLIMRMQARHLPTLRGLSALLMAHADDDSLVTFLERTRDAPSTLPPAVSRPVRRLLRDRELLRAIEYVESLDRETARLRSATREHSDELDTQEMLDRIRIRRHGAVSEAAAHARESLRRTVEELDEYLRFRVPLVTPSLEWGERTSPRGAPSRALAVSDGEIAWPFEGEYWRDELGTYRVPITSWCGR
jgi:hypothetical protein